MSTTTSAFADAVNNNANALHMTVGTTYTVGYSIQPTGQGGCDVSSSNPVTIVLQDVPAGVNTSPASLTFTSCNTVQNFSFTADESAVPNPDGPPYKVTVAVTSGSGVDNLTGGNMNIFVEGTPEPPVVEDNTAPVVTGTPNRAPNVNGWYNAPVTVTWTGVDETSSVTCDAPITYSGPDGTSITVAGYCTDESGNTGIGSVTINYDATAPSITHEVTPSAPNANGWYNQDVTVVFTATDGTSGIDGDLTSTVVLGEGANQSASASFTDLAGNSASFSVTGINIDKTAPTISATQGSTYILGQPVTSDAACVDSLSGIDSCVVPSVSTSSVGAQSYTVSSQDLAGNTSTLTVTYNVNYGCLDDGFKSPIPNTQYKVGRGVPAKFVACDYYNNPVSTVTAFAYIDNTAGKSAGKANVGNLFRYDSTAGQYIFNFDTNGLTLGSHVIKAVLDSGQTITATVNFTK